MNKITSALTKKWGPLPAWVWLFGGGLVYYLYRKYSTTASGTGTGSVGPAPVTPQPQTVLQPGESVYDPNTGALTTAPGGGGSTDGSGGATAADLTDAMNNLANAIASGMPAPQVDNGTAGSDAVAAAVSPAAVAGHPAGTRPRLTARGAVYAPFGHNRPRAKAGYTIKGLGRGFWEYVPKRTTKSKGQHHAQGKTSKPVKTGRTTRGRSATSVRSTTAGRATARKPTPGSIGRPTVTNHRSVSTSQQPSRARQRPRQPAAQQVVTQRRPASTPRPSPTRQTGSFAPRPSAPPPRTYRAPAPAPRPSLPPRKRGRR